MHRPFQAITVLIAALAALLFLNAQSETRSPQPRPIVLRPRPYVYVSKWQVPRRANHEFVAVPSVLAPVSVIAPPALETPPMPTYESGCGRDLATGDVYPITATSNSDEQPTDDVESAVSAAVVDPSFPLLDESAVPFAVQIATCGVTLPREEVTADSPPRTAGLWWRQTTDDVVTSMTTTPRQIAEAVTILAERGAEWSSSGVEQLETLPALAIRPYFRIRG